MKCPYCKEKSTRVVDTRESNERVRRRRECPKCERRFTTYETIERFDIKVVKEDGDKEDFEEAKIRKGIEKASEKTGLTDKEIDEVVEEVKNAVSSKKQVKAKDIGEKVMEGLKKRDDVAYIRFASVYQSFEDAESFQEEIKSLQKVED